MIYELVVAGISWHQLPLKIRVARGVRPLHELCPVSRRCSRYRSGLESMTGNQMVVGAVLLELGVAAVSRFINADIYFAHLDPSARWRNHQIGVTVVTVKLLLQSRQT